MKEILLASSRSSKLELLGIDLVEAGNRLPPVRNTSPLASLSVGAEYVWLLPRLTCE